MSALLTAALDAAARGWHVFPLRPGAKRPALHGEAQCPHTGTCATGHVKWEQRATTDPGRIRAAWSTGAFNVGIATGPSGLVVVDLDRPKSKDASDAPCGAATFEALCERAGHAVPTTYRVRTASGGEHLYFVAPAGVRLGNTAGTLAPLVDTRAWGGYVVAAGSTVHGTSYEVVDDRPILELPAWLLDLLQTPSEPARAVVRPAAPRDASRVAWVALERETAAVATTGEGGRNAALLRGARAVGRFVAWGEIPRHVAEEAFQGAGEAAGLPPAECRATIRSALDWSIRTAHPREVA
ncbi:bifunctional DNA primase/polymerase [Streptomyces somaliensis]|uniref:bifunctional DNA primase/polymerase n=1 Tax=Streptomyces somaliensis TaxID=78355 RepID=UPI0020CBD32E|nr:bifunctional DNA primase/polymerase [Streptomyces somaliensis]MCP9945423.1 bifunctional DNA primase/polymerase [Streptomyces somaliensis]MCP9961379.1 bifunctional DNA primase/polymerase [Streptomyces somaliensis]MCP9974186.1 bifunctional DNA primase/polymerase [Streptomyces somaliensis]